LALIVPLLILSFLLWAFYKKVNAYEAFTEGAMEALPLLGKVLPFMASMMIALSAFRQSGALEWIRALLGPLGERVGLSSELLPLFLLRPFSGNGAMALLEEVFQSCGPDSRESYAASVMLGSTETIFYCMALYFGSVGIKKGRYALPAALLASLVGTASALLFSGLRFS